MIRIEYDITSNPNYAMTRWIEENPSSSANLGRLMIPIEFFNELLDKYGDIDDKSLIRFEERTPK